MNVGSEKRVGDILLDEVWLRELRESFGK